MPSCSPPGFEFETYALDVCCAGCEDFEWCLLHDRTRHKTDVHFKFLSMKNRISEVQIVNFFLKKKDFDFDYLLFEVK